MNASLTAQMQAWKIYDDGAMSVFEVDFFTWVVQISEKFSNRTGKKQSAQIASVLFLKCNLWKIAATFWVHFRGHFTSYTTRREKRFFVHIFSPDIAPELKDCRIIPVKALQNIDLGEVFYRGYGSEYCFP